MTGIRTYTGKTVDIESPVPAQIAAEDIAHALSYLCRGSGQTKIFFSVVRHCVYCALEALNTGCSKDVALICLLHDASEAYMADVPKPIKTNLIPAYKEYEDRLLGCIYQKFLGRMPTGEEATAVREIDSRLLQYDLRYLLGADVTLPKLSVEVEYAYIPFEEAERQYLHMLDMLTEGKQREGKQ